MAHTQSEWKERPKEVWESYWETRNHPHRKLALKQLKGKKVNSILEVGCASGPMLKYLGDHFKCKLAGFDISEGAIELAKKKLPKGDFKVFDMFSGEFPYKDNQFDLVIADAVLFYASHNMIEMILREMKRITKKYILLVEFHDNKDHTVDGYYIYNYQQLLKELGFKNIKMTKITNWEGFCWEHFGYVIVAKK